MYVVKWKQWYDNDHLSGQWESQKKKFKTLNAATAFYDSIDVSKWNYLSKTLCSILKEEKKDAKT